MPSNYSEKYYRFQYVEDAQKDDFLNVRGAGLVMRNPAYRNKQIMPDTLFEYIIDGEGYIYYDGVKYNVKKGDCIVARGEKTEQKEISYGSSKENPYLKLWFTAGGRFIDSMFNAFDIKEPITIKNCNILKLFQDYVMSLSTNGFDALSTMTVITTIMYAVYNNGIPTAETDDFDELVDNYIEHNIQCPSSPIQAATDLGMSQRNFSEYFKKRFNTNYKQYMRRQRLQHAKKILEHKKDNHSISQIANSLGFCDQSYFSNCFKKEFGVYPSEYRKQIMENNNKG